jgi:hypothetical protein
MSRVITRNAHARTLANSELPMATPSDLPHTLGHDGPFVSPTTSPPAPVRPSHTEEHVDNQGNPSPHTNTGVPEVPNGDPDPSDDEPDGGPDGDDGDERRTEELNNDDPFEAHGGADNLSVRDLLRILGPILAERRGPPHTPPAAPPNPRRLKVNSPEEFDGHSPKKLKSFLVSCNHAFRADPDTFRPHGKRVSYALSYLRGSAQRHFDTQLEDEEDAEFVPPDWLHDWPRFVEELRDMFGDPNAEATAEADLDGLRMRANQKFSDFLVEFNTLSSQVNWGDRALRHRLKHALPDRIKDSLVLVEEPVAFNDWKRLVQNIDQRYWERQAEIRRDTQPSTNTNRGIPPSSALTPTPESSPAPSATATRDSTGTSSVARHLTPQGGLTQTERDRRIAQNLCLYCGGQGHKASECSKARKAHEMSRKTVQAMEPTPSPTVPSSSTHMSDPMSSASY